MEGVMPSSIEEAFDDWCKAWRKEALSLAVASIALPNVTCHRGCYGHTLSEEALIEALGRIPK
jgi:hypothetical protein